MTRLHLRLGAWLLLSLSAASASAALSLTPRREEYELEGIKMWRLAFQTGAGEEARYRPPEGWQYSGSQKRLNVRPPGKTEAEGSITRLDTTDFPACDASGAKALAEIALRSIPEGAEQAKVESQAGDAIELCGRKAYLLQLSYTYYGERFSRYCLYLVADGGPMRFQFTCRQDEYKVLSRAFEKSLYTWQRL
jgi:hypothetical protein